MSIPFKSAVGLLCQENQDTKELYFLITKSACIGINLIKIR